MDSPEPQAPPPAQPPIKGAGTALQDYGPLSSPTSLWSIGQPTDEEQLYLEYINRARANPTAEGKYFATNSDPDLVNSYQAFSVDLALMIYEFSTNVVMPPLAMNLQLMTSARNHTMDMFTNRFQSHTGSTGATLATRLVNAGYPYSTAAENIYSYAKSVLHGHAGFEVDWGSGPTSVGGMQNPAGHRENIHSSLFREVGIGVMDGDNPPVGPQVVTQDFGTRGGVGNVPLVTGVAYYDLNGNNAYDVGEGVGGITVVVSNSTYYAVTADSGGYTVPVTTNGNYAISFVANGLITQRVATVSALKNVKVDFVPPYAPPLVAGPNPAVLNDSNYYTFSAVGAATAYDWRAGVLANYTLVEGAESGVGDFAVEAPAGYNVVATGTAASGAASYHLSFTNNFEQRLTLNPLFYLTSTSQLSFAKMLGYAGTGQVAQAQISINDGGSWTTLWRRSGTGAGGETSFTATNIPLGTYAGRTAKIRFSYDFIGGAYYPQTSQGVGFYLDNIAVSNARQVQNPTTNSVGANRCFSVTPTSTNQVLLSVRAWINTRALDWGPVFVAPVVPPSPSLQVLPPVLVGGQVTIDFRVSNFRSGMTFQLRRSAGIGAGWVQDAAATLTTITAGSKYRFTAFPSGTGPSLYDVKADY